MPRGAALCLVVGLFGCRTIGAAPEAELRVDRLEVSFSSASRGQLELGLVVRGGGKATKAQWQLLLDGQPLGSGVCALAQQLAEQGPSKVALTAPLLATHTARDEGWRTVTLELSGELTVQRRLEERLQFSTRKQVLVRGAPKF
ncbi:MAG: hypothetical protein H6Q89_3101 [Myxococcaceae bacterium]|nr:hypothetical protein [Myxococcaceae bacterium]